MANSNRQDLRFLQLNFIGRILAGFTHEIKNYIAIVKESAGLMGDMIKAGKWGKSESRQYMEIIASVDEQIERSLTLFRYLNRFAHKMDTPYVSFDVNEGLEELLALMNRFANQRKIKLETDFQKNLSLIQSDPAMLQFLVFCFVREKLDRLDKDSSITVKTGNAENSVTISIIAQGRTIDAETEVPCSPEIRQHVITMLGGEIVEKDGGIRITLPLNMPDILSGGAG
jgi:C4-dicarboxylate-specific signal transduction histidine kinase